MAAFKITLLLAAVMTISVGHPAAGQAADEPVKPAHCTVDTEQMMQLEPKAFDQDMNGGWRPLASQDGCEKAAADLIKTYIDRNWRKLEPSSLHPLYWHEGQMEAAVGDYRAAKALMMAGVNPDKRGMELGFYEYALGTIAFLNRDLAGLKASRRRLAALPEPSWFKVEFEGTGLQWPANLSVLDSLIRCFNAPYAIAYMDKCPAETKAPQR
ncbi:hypothetical protein [Nitrospirillum sp. BR 11828]|uniref:hypothetical protein n=1 Tax=Nitrospirillum sp. BR 11828 TaxID=3104325 RepID=UPI002ACA024A|nr:hypothetical protein [Nitrospirillum sp. BR 11828]MDZ5649896.1 hypothetical protein [Nitrospirillum sp. BR 11828]